MFLDRVPRENPCIHGDDMQTPQRKAGIWPSSCELAALTSAPLQTALIQSISTGVGLQPSVYRKRFIYLEIERKNLCWYLHCFSASEVIVSMATNGKKEYKQWHHFHTLLQTEAAGFSCLFGQDKTQSCLPETSAGTGSHWLIAAECSIWDNEAKEWNTCEMWLEEVLHLLLLWQAAFKHQEGMCAAQTTAY